MRPGDAPAPELHARRTEWLRGAGGCADVVLSSRVRLARNIAGLPFVNKATRSDLATVLELCRDAVLAAGLGAGSGLGGGLGEGLGGGLGASAAGPSGMEGGVERGTERAAERGAERTLWVDLREASALDRALLLERRLISHTLANNPKRHGTTNAGDPRGVAASIPSERVSVMVNEEDHLRVQAMRSGLALREAWDEADALDDRLEARLEFAFSPRFGYLTACPTNVGTGARFSVMMHLPALAMTGEIEKVKRAASDMSLAVRGFAGEGTESVGDFFQVSNQTTLGRSERELRGSIEERVVPRVVEYERDSRALLLAQRRRETEDRVWRAWGALASARLLTTQEAVQLLSLVRLGVLLELLRGPTLDTVHHLLLLVQPAHLQRTLGREMPPEERRFARAALVRARLGG